MRNLLILLPFILLISCVSDPKLSNEGENIVIISKMYTPKDCQVLDVVSGRRNSTDGIGLNFTGAGSFAMIEVKNEAAKRGANAVYVVSTDTNVHGVVTIVAEALLCTDL